MQRRIVLAVAALSLASGPTFAFSIGRPQNEILRGCNAN
jgi:hypothetical protein